MKAELNIKDFSTADITKLISQAFSDPKLVKIFEATLRKATGKGLSEDIFSGLNKSAEELLESQEKREASLNRTKAITSKAAAENISSRQAELRLDTELAVQVKDREIADKQLLVNAKSQEMLAAEKLGDMSAFYTAQEELNNLQADISGLQAQSDIIKETGRKAETIVRANEDARKNSVAVKNELQGQYDLVKNASDQMAVSKETGAQILDLSKFLTEQNIISIDDQIELNELILEGRDYKSTLLELEERIQKAHETGNVTLEKGLGIAKRLVQIEQKRAETLPVIEETTSKYLNKMTALTDQVPFLGKMISSYLTDGMKRFNETLSKSLAEGATGFSALGKSVGKSFGVGGTILLGIAGIGIALAGIYKLVTAFDDKISETAQSMGTTKEAAMELTLAAGRAGMTQEQHLKAVQALNKAYGGMNVVNAKNADIYKDQLKTISDLQLGFGLSADEAGELAMVANTLGGDVTTMTGAVLEQVEALEAGGNHLVNQADVLKDISKLGRVNAMVFGKNVTALTKAAAAARMLGTDINSVIASGEKQLDIETSLTQEMRLRVFTGADISQEMDAFREASLFGDPDQLMQAKTDVMTKVNDAIKSGDKAMVGLATKQYAELMGITAEQAAKEFQNLDLVKAMGFDMNEFLKGDVSEDQMLAKRKDLTKEQQAQLDTLIKERKSQKLSQEFEEGLTKLKEAVAPFLAPLAENLGSIVEGLTHFVEWIAKGTNAISNMAGSLFGFGGATEVTTEQIAAYAAENKISQDEAKTKLEEKAKAEEESGSSLGAWTAGIAGAGAAFFGLKKAVGAVRESPFFEAIMGKTEDAKQVDAVREGTVLGLQDFHGTAAKGDVLSKQAKKEKPGMIKSFMNWFKRDKSKAVVDKAKGEGTETGKKPGVFKRIGTYFRRDKSKQMAEDVQGDATSKKPNVFKRIGSYFKRDKSKQIVDDVQGATPDTATGKKPSMWKRAGDFFKGKGKGKGKFGAIASLAGSLFSSDLAQDAISTVTGQTPEDAAMAKLTGETSPAGNIVSNLAGGDIGAAAGDLVGGGAGGGALTAGIDAAMAGGGIKDIAGAALGSFFGGGETVEPEMPAEPELTGDFYSDIFVYLDMIVENLQQLVQNTGGSSASAETPKAEEASSGGFMDFAKNMLGKTKIGKKLGLGKGGMMDSMLDMATGGGGGGGGGTGGSGGGGGGDTGGGGMLDMAMDAVSDLGGSSKAPSVPGGTAPAAPSGGGGGFLSRVGSWFSEKASSVGNALGKLNPMKAMDGIKDKLGGFLKSSFGKALGPIMTAVMSIGNIYSLIQDGKAKLAAGETMDFGSFGKQLVQSAAYPIASTLIMIGGNAIPGLGTAISLADAALGAVGMSPIKWISDHIVDIFPNEAFTGLGKFALGVEGEGAQPQTAQPTVEGGMNETVKVQANDFVIEPNSNDKIGGVLDNRSVTEMVSLLQQMVGLLGQRQEVVLSPGTANAIVTMGTSNKSFKK